jgi:CheY-like chemotaxis protein
MPEMNGFELVDKIRAHSSRSATPILVLTADNALGTINKLAKSGADNFIVKPWNRQLLVQKMLYCLEGRKD